MLVAYNLASSETFYTPFGITSLGLGKFVLDWGYVEERAQRHARGTGRDCVWALLFVLWLGREREGAYDG